MAVPLELKALAVAHARHGKLKWNELVAPAAELARNGFPAHPYLINTLTNPQIQKAYAPLPCTPLPQQHPD